MRAALTVAFTVLLLGLATLGFAITATGCGGPDPAFCDACELDCAKKGKEGVCGLEVFDGKPADTCACK